MSQSVSEYYIIEAVDNYSSDAVFVRYYANAELFTRDDKELGSVWSLIYRDD